MPGPARRLRPSLSDLLLPDSDGALNPPAADAGGLGPDSVTASVTRDSDIMIMMVRGYRASDLQVHGGQHLDPDLNNFGGWSVRVTAAPVWESDASRASAGPGRPSSPPPRGRLRVRAGMARSALGLSYQLLDRRIAGMMLCLVCHLRIRVLDALYDSGHGRVYEWSDYESDMPVLSRTFRSENYL